MYRSYYMEPPAVDADGIAKAQTLAGAGNLLLNGDLISGGVFDIEAAGYSSGIGGVRIAIDSAGNVASVNFTVTGTNQDGVATSEVITGVTTTEVQSLTFWRTITSIAADDAVGSNVNVGTVDEVVTPTIPMNWRNDFAGTIGVSGVTGTLSWGTDESISEFGANTDPSTLAWIGVQTGKSANLMVSASNYITALRCVWASYSTGAAMTFAVRQQDYNS